MFRNAIVKSSSVWWVVVLLACACLAPPCSAAAPADELLRLVPADVGFCVVVRDLRGHSQRLAASPFMKQFQAHPVGKALRESPEVRKLQEFENLLRTQFKTSLEEIRDAILGDAIVLAYWPAQPDQPHAERGLLLIRPRDPTVLANVVAQLNRVQKESGELTSLETRQHQGVTYYRRVEKVEDVSYYVLHGPTLGLSEDEATVKQLIETLKEPPAASKVLKEIDQLDIAEALVVFWLNPRAFDAAMRAQAQQAADPLATFLKTFQGYWQELQGIAVALYLRQDIEVSLCLRMDTTRLPNAAQQFLAAAKQPSRLWTAFPERTMFAMAGRFDVAAFTATVNDFLPADTQKALREGLSRMSTSVLGRDWDMEVLPALGPDWGLYIAPPPPGAKTWFPDVVIALGVQSKQDEKQLDKALFEAMRVALGLSLLTQIGNPNAPLLRTEKQGQVTVVSLANEKVFPPGFQPALASKASCLVFASSPGAIRRFAESNPGAKEARVENGVLLARLSIGEVSAYLKQHRTSVVANLVEQKQVPAAEAGQRLDGLLSILELFDRVDVLLRTTPNQANLILQIRPSKPLRGE